MWSRLYRNHVIMPFPSYDTAKKAWAPQADISWCSGPLRNSEFIRFPNRVTTESEAVISALRRGQGWIDNRLRHLRNGPGLKRGQVIDMIGALKKTIEKARPTRPPRDQMPSERRAEKTFTFEQFKSAIVKNGLNPTEQTLQKSYAALVKLRKREHWSWTQMRRKVEESQQDLRVAQLSTRRPRAARIPVTERAWRKLA
jgi:hypothetical protein